MITHKESQTIDALVEKVPKEFRETVKQESEFLARRVRAIVEQEASSRMRNLQLEITKLEKQLSYLKKTRNNR